MGLDYIRKNDTVVFKGPEGAKELERLIGDSDAKTVFLPPSISLQDIDMAVFNLFKEDGKLSIDFSGKQLNIHMLGQERWSEFDAMWAELNSDGNLEPPFLTMSRNSEAAGTMWGTRFTIPNRKKFTYMSVPVIKDGMMGLQRYKVPQPTPVDITHEVRLYTRLMSQVNKMAETMLYNFSDRQLYIYVNGHPFPTMLEEISGEDTMEEYESNRYFVKVYRLITKAYLYRQEESSIVDVPNRLVNIIELDKEIIARLETNLTANGNQ